MYKPGAEKLVLLELKDELEKIRDRLTRGTSHRDVVSIVGMSGIGKTTMARRLYGELEYRFHVRAFCCVSQRYDKKQLLVEVLNQVPHRSYETDQMGFEDLGELLYRSLKERRYLIVLDDMWEIGAWDDLGIYFPRDHNQSRILVTTREKDVALKIKSDSPPHYLRLLSEEESWELLEKKTFLHQGKCPPELLGVARKIAKSCKGLPIAIVVVAGILATTEQEREKWEQIAESVGKHAQTECLHIFELSYDHLPEQLKDCFLYFAAFEEDSEIPVRKLIQYWVAEEFVPRGENKCLEDLAECYLTELVDRSLVMVSQRRCNGGIKTCHLHDFIHEYCLAKAKEVNFMQRNDGHAGMLSTARMCSHDREGEAIKHLPTFDRGLISLLFFGPPNYLAGRVDFRDHYSLICGLKNLKVLKLYDVVIDGDFFKMKLPVCLRYLGINHLSCSFPESICNLLDLEILDVYLGRESIFALPHAIWTMVKLRHLHVGMFGGYFRMPVPGESNLENLQVLSGLHLPDVETCAEKVFKALPRLRRLKCCVINSYPFGLLPLNQLESLNVVFISPLRPPRVSEFSFPPNLKKLTLKGFKLSKGNISTIARLPNLEVLKLLKAVFVEEKLCLGQFSKLKFFKFSDSNVWQWNASVDDFPCLEMLAVKECFGLESIPACFGEILTLRSIDVVGCSSSVESSARQIQEVQMEMGNQEFEVHIRDIE